MLTIESTLKQSRGSQLTHRRSAKTKWTWQVRPDPIPGQNQRVGQTFRRLRWVGLITGAVKGKVKDREGYGSPEESIVYRVDLDWKPVMCKIHVYCWWNIKEACKQETSSRFEWLKQSYRRGNWVECRLVKPNCTTCELRIELEACHWCHSF